jgi:hypothetical protein
MNVILMACIVISFYITFSKMSYLGLLNINIHTNDLSNYQSKFQLRGYLCVSMPSSLFDRLFVHCNIEIVGV